NRRSNNNTPDSFSSLVTTGYSAEFNHSFSSRWFLRASASRAHMDRDSLITAKFTNAPVNSAGTTRAPSPTTGAIEVVPTVRGDLLASPDGQLAYDNLASNAAQINLLGHFDFNRVS